MDKQTKGRQYIVIICRLWNAAKYWQVWRRFYHKRTTQLTINKVIRKFIGVRMRDFATEVQFSTSLSLPSPSLSFPFSLPIPPF